MSLAFAVAQIWHCVRILIMADESSRLRRGAREMGRKCFWRRAPQACASETGLASTRYLVELVESILKVIREEIRGNEELSDVAA